MVLARVAIAMIQLYGTGDGVPVALKCFCCYLLTYLLNQLASHTHQNSEVVERKKSLTISQVLRSRECQESIGESAILLETVFYLFFRTIIPVPTDQKRRFEFEIAEPDESRCCHNKQL